MSRSRVSRDNSSPCGSGKKFNHCCMSWENGSRFPRSTAQIIDLHGKPRRRPKHLIGPALGVTVENEVEWPGGGQRPARSGIHRGDRSFDRRLRLARSATASAY